MTQSIQNIPHSLLEQAQAAAANLEALWPLDSAQQLDNDVHFGDNMQVRQTFEIAKLLLGIDSSEAADITLADAEYVFEGAEEIPGRPQVLVDALLAANDAFEQAHNLQENGDAMTIVQIAACLADGGAVSADLGQIDALLDADDAQAQEDGDDDVSNLLRGFRLAAAVSQVIVDSSEDPVNGPALMMLIANEYLDSCDSPRTFAKAQQLIDVYESQVDDASAIQLVETAAQHWQYRHDEILWDKDEAKRLAKEEDERKSKAALAEKFAHIKDDPNKPEVEL
ncbi:hypothetical protein [Alloscardovia omnicolens]|uniref:hypothetical protein n=1 Tax=Alloscardovia omnicolens TaxID=419015 RepID=UPI003A6531AC